MDALRAGEARSCLTAVLPSLVEAVSPLGGLPLTPREIPAHIVVFPVAGVN